MRWMRICCGALFAASLGCGDNLADPDLPTGPTIFGSVFEDDNTDGVHDDGEPAIAEITVFLDRNDNGVRDNGEPSTTTSASGEYRFTDLAAGDYIVRQEIGFGLRNVSGAEAARALEPQRPRLPGEKGAPTSGIIGGSVAAENAYPFMVGVGFLFASDQVFRFCGGVLVSDRFVVTAAHCSEGEAPEDVGVIIGTNDADNPAGAGQVIAVAAITIHPEWDGDVETGNDIAVWELAEVLDLEARGVNSIEMVSTGTAGTTVAGALATTIGWGVSDNPSPLLQEVHVPITSSEECGVAYPQVASFATQICAGAPSGGIDSCQGDSGGPLMVRSGDRWLHAGITSWGDGCALAGKPGIYGRTSALSAWATGLMLEPSGAHRVTVADSPVAASFGNQRTVRPLIEAIDARWQLTSMTLAGVVNGAIAANTPIDVDFGLLDELEAGERSFVCEFDPDGPGAAAPQATTCTAGDNQLSFAGYSDGAFQATLTVSADGVDHIREQIVIAGTPSSDAVSGDLTDQDQTDPDFSGTYYIDHFEVTATTDNVVIIADVTADFAVFLALYDADVRNSSGGGRIRAAIGFPDASFSFIPEPGRRYLIGVSTLGEGEVGAYTVTLTNNGTPTPFTL